MLDFEAEASARKHTRLEFDDPPEDRVAAYFHTGGTTGMPKVAQHKVSGMVFNGWIGAELLFDETDVLMCPLPLFHVFAAYPILMSCIGSKNIRRYSRNAVSTPIVRSPSSARRPPNSTATQGRGVMGRSLRI